ncbi:hypothetical protein BDY19DRAFT_741875 [Irpex rosettiformis]|uniref:Uncharacterized protein n=1 Tax=Irpex rosettiformis TaxID=378272 RepID=A0ACB8U9G6_9APHY|nr:hypothetical protein BDY19DRAFT_741875 [Irpex rosettiformis]
MHMFKKKEDNPSAPPQLGEQQMSRFQASNPRASLSMASSPRPPALNSPAVNDHSPRPPARRSILRNPHDNFPSMSSMSPHSRAALMLASSANTGGSISLLPTSPSSPALYPGSNTVTSNWGSPGMGQSSIPPSTSLPQIAPHIQHHHEQSISPYNTSAMPNPYGSSFHPSNYSRGSASSSLRPLSVRKTPPFPFPTEAAALHTLARILRTETKRFRISDFIDIEEGEFAALVEAKERERNDDAMPLEHAHAPNPRTHLQAPRGRRMSMWDGEEEDETVTDCVRDKMLDEGNGASRWKSERTERSEKRRREREMRFKDLHLFGTHLEDLPDFALSPVVIGGYLHEVPVAVAAAIEELVIARLKEPNFFNSRPDRKQLFELVSRFDQLVATNASYGRLVPPPLLSNESTQSIYSLLVTYLSALPHTIIPRPLVDALWCWCVSPSVTRAQRARIVRNGSEASESEHETSDEENDHPNYAERLRRRERDFLDLPSFRVQIRVASDKEGDQTSNGIALHDIARAFGGVLLGGRDWKRRNSVKYRDGVAVNGDRDRTSKEQKVMTWLVNHWGRIVSAYELDEDPGDRLGESIVPRATSLPAKESGAARPSTHGPLGENALAQLERFDHSPATTRMPGEGYNLNQDLPGQVGPVPSSECQSLSSGETADPTPLSDWEELPIISTTHPTYSNGKIHARRQGGKGEQVLNTLPARDAEEEDILDYYSGDSRSLSFGISGSEEIEDARDNADDDMSLYSNDDIELEPGSHGVQAELEQDCTTKTAAQQASAAEVISLRRQLRQALDERDQARRIVDAMQNIIGAARV